MGPGGVPKAGGARKRSQGGVAASSPIRSGKDGDLMSTMLARLQKLEALNTTYKKELQEKTEEIALLKDMNK